MEYDELACTLCSSHFDLDELLPRMIPQCGHTFCSKCLQNILDTNLPGEDFICPEDKYYSLSTFLLYLYRISMPLTQKDILSFPKNYILIRLIEKRQSIHNPDKNIRQGTFRRCYTKEEDSPSEKLSFIKERLSVPRINSGSTIKTTSSSDGSYKYKDDDNICMGLNFDPNICQEHQRKFEVVCLDHKCKICTNCALFGSHKNHDIKSEGEIFKEITIRAEKLIDVLQELEKDEKDILEAKHLDEFRMKVNTKYNELSKSVREKFSVRILNKI